MKDCGMMEGNRHEENQKAPGNRKDTWPENDSFEIV